jgi:hypothetical protein
MRRPGPPVINLASFSATAVAVFSTDARRHLATSTEDSRARSNPPDGQKED